jgi:hypothetical protein
MVADRRKHSNFDGNLFVITKICRDHPRSRTIRWTWEIRRRSKQLEYAGGEYANPQDARAAGEKALKEIVQQLSQKTF